ncbi:unnamed protein product [Rotaria socialis]|uniref:NAD(+)--protein-arginine ADP-ribosyltransferase n=1 Tax=Rotaria socialis TaxID=392032 RepID=A0A818KTD9_9BILA|nr:unnamed protein product [Rotaria socialis]CAF4445483.1 unnamed protein product [Rotaria socialis]
MSTNPQAHKEGFVIVYLDATSDTNNSQEQVVEQLHELHDKIQIFSISDQCIDYLIKLENVHVIFLFITDTIDHPVLTCISNLSSVSLIYILYTSSEKIDECQLQSFRKVVRISPEIHQLMDRIKYDIRRLQYEHMIFEILSKSNTSTLSKNLNKQEYSFMFTKLLKGVFLNFQDDSTPELVEYCQSLYRNDSVELCKIDEFKRLYKATDAISWYTRDTFVYRKLNEALRTQNVEALYKMRTFIRHLHQQLVSIQTESHILIPPLYRGVNMNIDEFKNIRNNEGGLFSISSFQSTSSNRNIAAVYAGESDREKVAVIFKIKIDSNEVINSSCACVEQYSYLGSGENEWLFSIGSGFRIEKVERIENIMQLI